MEPGRFVGLRFRLLGRYVPRTLFLPPRVPPAIAGANVVIATPQDMPTASGRRHRRPDPRPHRIRRQVPLRKPFPPRHPTRMVSWPTVTSSTKPNPASGALFLPSTTPSPWPISMPGTRSWALVARTAVTCFGLIHITALGYRDRSTNDWRYMKLGCVFFPSYADLYSGWLSGVSQMRSFKDILGIVDRVG